MKGSLIAIAAALSAVFAFSASAADAPKKEAPVKFKLKYTENFSKKKLDGKFWGRIGEGKSDWSKHMSTRDDLVVIEKGVARLLGIKNDGRDPGEKRPVLTGGISTKGRFTMLYGKVEARVKFEAQKGAWPAFWMMPENSPKGWPAGGEIDIFERLNSDGFVYQTVHSAWMDNKDPKKVGKGKIDPDGWNVYAVEWTPGEIVWTVNGKRTHSYKNEGKGEVQYPWTVPFFIMIDQQLGGKWAGSVDEKTLPVAMHVDWIKFYDAYRGSKKISTLEFVKSAKKK